ncbi:putative N-ethylmaleimide reductase [Lasiosphaeris hirsuta]|uniref:N-ethylmaleimide reductase n=1 Tax=Lasiosphaeris hirsuta TaxID=260670 RepID=A0AA40AG65_9PEZI|nr:putative N-ethylmaleimide reductase [Lasiosphaeris hirsuta]
MSQTRLFQPLKVGTSALKQRIGMSPLTRYRATDDHVPTPLMVEYYTQRASAPGTLIVTEATFMSAAAGGYNNVPGIYNRAQIDGWRKITDAVHAKGSFIYVQLWHLGRTAEEEVATREGFKVKAPSAIQLDAKHPVPEALTVDEIKQIVQDYATAAKNAVEAGFDGVELHGANGYLIDQFLQDVTNERTDEYGGSIENRSRLAVEVIDSIVEAIGAEKTGIRLSPWSVFQGMRMESSKAIAQFTDVIKKINRHKLAYIHLIRADKPADRATATDGTDLLDWAVELIDSPILIANGLEPDTAKALVDDVYPNKEVVAIFGRHFIATPDLVFRISEGIKLNQIDYTTIYAAKSPKGYTDYPFSKEFESKFGAQASLN